MAGKHCSLLIICIPLLCIPFRNSFYVNRIWCLADYYYYFLIIFILNIWYALNNDVMVCTEIFTILCATSDRRGFVAQTCSKRHSLRNIESIAAGIDQWVWFEFLLQMISNRSGVAIDLRISKTVSVDWLISKRNEHMIILFFLHFSSSSDWFISPTLHM